MPITKIHGFKRDSVNFSSRGEQFVLTAVVQVEATSPLDELENIVFYLPSFASGPGSTSFNPRGLTFTLFQSTHPADTRYWLASVDGMTRDGDTHFWDVPVTYMTPPPNVPGFSPPQEQRKDQKVKKPSSKKKKDQTPITNPLERPAIFNGSTKTVERQSYFDSNNNPIIHTNGLPITEPISFLYDHDVWTWTWNISSAQYFLYFTTSSPTFTGMASACNDDNLSIGAEGGSLTITKETLKCNGFQFQENWETPSGSKEEHHYIRVTGTFERAQGHAWTTPPLSMHTKEYVDLGDTSKGHQPIQISLLPRFAKEPWPLTSTGVGVPYRSIDSYPIGDFGRVQAGGADLKMIDTYDFQAFFDKWDLDFPQDRD